MKKKTTVLLAASSLAARMAAHWNNEYLMSKTPEDLMRAYGCDKDSAVYILKNELTKRNLRR